MIIEKILIFLLIQILPTYCLGSQNEKHIFTICEVKKTVSLHIVPFNSEYKDIFKASTNFSLNQELTGETYSLVFEKIANKKAVNLYYKSKKYPDLNWNIWENINTQNVKFSVLNETTPENLILNVFYEGVQQQTYYFNLDGNGNGFLSIVNTRWSSMFNAHNNQTLYFCTCKGDRISKK